MVKFYKTLMISLFMAGMVFDGAMGQSPVPQLNLSSDGLALRGHDPVAYFKAGTPKKGDPSLMAKHAGGLYHFSSQKNKILFESDPGKYLPAYGGYCAYGTAVNAKVDGDPNVWNIVDGKLYLNINRSVDRTWKRKKQTYIRQADKIWPKLRDQ